MFFLDSSFTDYFEIWGATGLSVSGPLLFVIYLSGLSSLLFAHGVAYHFYADDTQFYLINNNKIWDFVHQECLFL